MKNLLICFVLLSFISCKDDNTDLEVNFKLTYENEPFTFFKDYTYPTGKTFRVTNISTYISDITIQNEANESELLSDVEFLDIGKTHQDLAGAEEGYSLLFGDVEIDDITTIDFRIGISPEQNLTVPSDYASSNPLSKTGEYWADWNSYIMTKVEGFYDMDGDGIAEMGFIFHLGSDSVTRNVSYTQVKDDNRIDFVLDVSEIFKSGTEFYDIETTPITHSLDLLEEANFVATNFAEALQLAN